MPMIDISGVPHETSQEKLVQLEDSVEKRMATAMGMEATMFHAYPHVSPTERTRPRDMIFGKITTAFFYENREEEETQAKARAATNAAAIAIWRCYGGKYTVEVFPPDYMDPSLRTRIKAAPAS